MQCISTLAFVKNEPEVLDSPIWVMIINIGRIRIQPLGRGPGATPAEHRGQRQQLVEAGGRQLGIETTAVRHRDSDNRG